VALPNAWAADACLPPAHRAASSSYRTLHLAQNQIALSHVLRLHRLETSWVASTGRVMTPPVYLGDPLFLVGDVALALRNMPSDFVEVSLLHRAIHDAA